MYSIGIDIGGMSAKVGLVCDGRILQEERIPTCSQLDYEEFLDQLCGVIGAMQERFPVQKLGISSCGLIDSAKGSIVYSNNIRWDNKQILSDLEKRTGLPGAIANDAKCAALAEAVLGAGKAYDRVCMITLGTGVGGGFVCQKQLTRGSIYADADGILGHITVQSNGRRCTCGRKGCLEAYASATAVMQVYREKTGTGQTAQEIFRLAAQGDPAAAETVEQFQFYLAQGLASIVNVLRPEVIVLGGGVAGSAEQFLPYLQKTVNEEAYGTNILPVQIVTGELGNAAGILGATLL